MKTSEVEIVKTVDINRFSSYNKLLRVTARVLAVFKPQPRPSLLSIGNELSISSLEEAEEFWIRDAQSQITDKEIANRFSRLGARRRDDGIVIVGERLEYWMKATYNNKDLILLPYGH